MNVLVIPEDFRKDQYMLKPVIAAMLNWIGVTARVEVCQDPLLGGVTEALKWERIVDIIGQYSWKVQLFLLCVDRDGNAHRRSALDGLEREAAKVLKPDRRFLAENAWQEIEVWVLAGHNLPAEWEWAAIRAERDAKEAYYQPFAELRGVTNSPGEGRRTLAEEAARRYSRVRQLCPEDIGALEERIRMQMVQCDETLILLTIARTRPMPKSITFGLGPEFLLRDGLTDTVALWEDGQRAETGRGSFEWWYFDAHLDDGSTAVIVFATKPLLARKGPLRPQLVGLTFGG